MALAVVQHKSQINGNAIPGSLSLTSAPTAGNLIIMHLGVNIAVSSLTIDTTKWTVFDATYQTPGSPPASYSGLMLYRYVVGGDTAALPAVATAGSTYSSMCAYEISGVTGTWDTDFQCCIGYTKRVQTNTAVPPIVIDQSGGMALAFASNYNGNSNPTVGGSWTLDEAQNNNTNYGSVAGAHRALSSGNTIDGTWSTANQDPATSFLVILAQTLPTYLYLKQVYSDTTLTGNPGTVAVPWTPHNGDLMLAYFTWGHGVVAGPTIGGSWTQFRSQDGDTGGDPMLIGLRRYVSGDTSTLAALTTAGGPTGIAVMILVFGGANGTFANDHVSDQSGHQASGATITTTSDATTAVNQSAVIAHVNFSSVSANNTLSGSFIVTSAKNNIGTEGAWGVVYQQFPTSGTTVQSTITVADSTKATAYIQSILGLSFSTETGTGVMALSGITLTDTGSVSHGGTIGMSFSGIVMNSSALRSAKAGNVQVVVVG